MNNLSVKDLFLFTSHVYSMELSDLTIIGGNNVIIFGSFEYLQKYIKTCDGDVRFISSKYDVNKYSKENYAWSHNSIMNYSKSTQDIYVYDVTFDNIDGLLEDIYQNITEKSDKKHIIFCEVNYDNMEYIAKIINIDSIEREINLRNAIDDYDANSMNMTNSTLLSLLNVPKVSNDELFNLTKNLYANVKKEYNDNPFYFNI